MKIAGTGGTSAATGPAARPQSVPPAAPAPVAPESTAPPGGEAPATDVATAGEPSRRGLLEAGRHSHRSPVAALRQWINHPGLRGNLAVPDVEQPGKASGGFEKAVSAYRAIVGETAPPDPAEPGTDAR